MALKECLVLIGLIFASIAVQMGEAQLRSLINPEGGINFDLLGIHVSLYCTPDGNKGLFSFNLSPFKGAHVLFQCGNGVIIASGTTNNFGLTNLVTLPGHVSRFLPPQSNCNLIVNTTLSKCNHTLAHFGGLESAIEYKGTTMSGKMRIASYVPTGFRFNPLL